MIPVANDIVPGLNLHGYDSYNIGDKIKPTTRFISKHILEDFRDLINRGEIK